MDLQYIIYIYLVITLLTFLVTWNVWLNFWEAYIVAMSIGFFLLWIMYPPYDLDLETDSLPCAAFYLFIICLTLLSVFIYAIIAAVKNRRNKCQTNTCKVN